MLRPFRIRLPTSQAFLSLRKETLRECAFGEEALLAPEATSASSASGLLFHTVTVCPAFKRLAAIREPIAPRPRNPAFACAVQRHGLPVGAKPPRQLLLQPVVIGAAAQGVRR